MKCLHKSTEIEMREDIVAGIIDMCSRNMYANTLDFKWYVSVLADLARLHGIRQGQLLSSQIIDVALRVPDIRQFAVNALLPLLVQPELVAETMQDVLIGVAWVVGEYSGCLEQQQIVQVFASLTSSAIIYLSPAIQAT